MPTRYEAVIPGPEEGPPTGSLPSSSRCDDIGRPSARLHIKREPDSRAQVDSSQARPGHLCQDLHSIYECCQFEAGFMISFLLNEL